MATVWISGVAAVDSCRRIQAGWGVHRASCPVGTGALFPGTEWMKHCANHLLSSSAEAYLHSHFRPVLVAWCWGVGATSSFTCTSWIICMCRHLDGVTVNCVTGTFQDNKEEAGVGISIFVFSLLWQTNRNVG